VEVKHCEVEMIHITPTRGQRSLHLVRLLGWLLAVIILLYGCAENPRKVLSIPPHLSGMRELPTPDDFLEKIALSESLGRALYYHDKAAAIATDVLAENLGDLSKVSICGYLTLIEGDDQFQPTGSWLVPFFTDRVAPKVAYEVRIFPGGSTTSEFKQIVPPTMPQEGMLCLFQARQTALEALSEKSQPINPVVLPGNIIGERGILVYLIAGTTKPDIVVFGKHYRVLVSEDGKRVKRFEPLTLSAFEMPLHPPNEPAGEIEGLVITHHLSEWPLETHVFVSLLHKTKIFVVTNRYIWKVEGGRICLVRSREDKQEK